DMLTLAASVRTDGKSLAEIARRELGLPAAVIASVAILFIVVAALAGLGFVVVKALGGEEVKLPAGMEIRLPANQEEHLLEVSASHSIIEFPAGCYVRYSQTQSPVFGLNHFGSLFQWPFNRWQATTRMQISLTPRSSMCKNAW